MNMSHCHFMSYLCLAYCSPVMMGLYISLEMLILYNMEYLLLMIIFNPTETLYGEN